MHKISQSIAAILCHEQGAFVKAHLAALNLGKTSILVPNNDYRVISDLTSRFGSSFEIFTDRPRDPRLNGCAVVAVSDLAVPEEFPQHLPSDQVVTMLLTSGTTGEAKLVAKTFGNFAAEVQSLDGLFRSSGRDVSVITTVPFEHMYGYVYGFFWPRMSGLDAPDIRVALPSDLTRAVTGAANPVWLVTTPIHLAAFVDAGLRLGNVERVFSATGPLSPQLAREAAQCFGVAITDIYGSTETGTVGWREMDGLDRPWNCLPLRHLRQAEDGRIEVVSPDYPQPEMLADLIEMLPAGQFRVVGRSSDLIKVAGKRTSLAGLNAALLSAPGVRDGIYWMPEDGDPGSRIVRPVAFVVLRENETTEAVMDHLRGHIDPVFLPRPLFAVDDLNRNAVGKMPREVLRALYVSCLSTTSSETDAAIRRQSR